MNLKLKIKEITTKAAVWGLLGLCACAAEDLTEDNATYNRPMAQTGVKWYAKIHIGTDNAISSRAAWDSEDDNGTDFFDKGLDAERAVYLPEDSVVENHLAFVFDNNGNLVGAPIKLDLTRNTTGDTNMWDSYIYIYNEENFEEYYQGNDYSGWQVFTVLNAGDNLIEKLEEVSTLSQLKNFPGSTGLTLDDYTYLHRDTGDYMTMTSSMVVKNGSGVPATEGELKFYRSEEEASAASNGLVLYVERLPAKYTLLFQHAGKTYYLPQSDDNRNADDLKDNSIDPYGSASVTPEAAEHLVIENTDDAYKLNVVTDYTRSSSIDNRNPVNIEKKNWKANILGWGINGHEQQEYLVKNLSASGDYVSQSWFSSASYPYRSFWAEDPNYSDGNYPQQYRQDITDETVTNYETMQNRTLDYFSFNELSQRKERVYTPENTFSLAPLGNESYRYQTYLRVGTHLIITAQLLVEGLDIDNLYNSTRYDSNGMLIYYQTSANTKYLMNDVYWSETAYKNYAAEYLAYWMLTTENQADTKFGPNDGNFYVDYRGTYKLADASNFELASAYIKGGDGLVYLLPTETIYIKNSNGEYIAIFDPEEETEVEDKYTQLVYAHPELMANRYDTGRMYYAAGTKQNQDSDFSNPVKLGDYGTVRNHWYQFTVSGIYHPGTGVDVADQKIIPNNQLEDAIGISLSVYDWHKIYQSVDINDQNPTGKNS